MSYVSSVLNNMKGNVNIFKNTSPEGIQEGVGAKITIPQAISVATVWLTQIGGNIYAILQDQVLEVLDKNDLDYKMLNCIRVEWKNDHTFF